MKLRSHTRANKPQLNIAPLIDVIFLLIIFFMVVSQFSQASLAPMELPEADQGQTATAPQPQRVIINVTREGTVMVGGQLLNMEALESYLQDKAAHSETELHILLRGDRLTSWQDVNRVLNRCAQMGKFHIRVAVAEPQATEGGQP